MLMNAENRKLMLGLMRLNPRVTQRLTTALTTRASFQMEMSRRAPVVFSHRQRG